MENRILKAMLYSVTFNVMLTPFSNKAAAIFGYISILLFIWYPFLQIFRSNKIKIHITVIKYIVMIAISIITSISFAEDITVENLESGIIAVISFIMFYWSLSLPVQKQNRIMLKEFCNINYFICLIYILYAFGPFEFKYQIVDKYGRTLFTMGLGNPNAVSTYVLFSIVLLCFSFMTAKKKIIKIINLVLIGMLAYILLLLSSRTAFICLIVILVYFIFKSKKIKYFPYVAMFFPVVMIVLQIRLQYFDIDYQFLGKSIDTGRSYIYQSVLDAFRENPMRFIFGDICNYWFENMHNGVLTIFTSLGIIGVILYFSFWLKQIKYLDKICITSYQKFAFFVLMVFIVESASESMLMIGTIPYSIFVLIIMRIARGEIASQDDRITKDRV